MSEFRLSGQTSHLRSSLGGLTNGWGTDVEQMVVLYILSASAETVSDLVGNCT